MIDPASWIEGWAAQAPDRTALRFGDRAWSYAALADKARRLAADLRRHGVAAGDRVALLALNHPFHIALLLACARLGALLVPLNWRLAPPELATILADAEPRLAFAEPELVPALAGAACPVLAPTIGTLPDDAPPAGGDRPLLLVYTSGTTGRPRGAVLTAGNLFWNAVNSGHLHGLTAADHVLTAIPLFHVGGLNNQTLPALHAGASVTLLPRFEPDSFLDAVETGRPTTTCLVPAIMQALLRHRRWPQADLSSLRLITAGSSTIPTALIRPFHERGIPVCQIYGATETCPIAIYLRPEDAVRKLGSTGRPAVHCRIRLVDGEIWVQGPNVAQGYWRDPNATAESFADGWFRTGDIAHQDADGFYYVDDRKKDLIISGGENIYPAELENVLADCPDIAEAAVVAGPDPRWGEVPVAVVVPRPGAALDAAQVLALFSGRLARFKHPKAVQFLDRLPRNAMGKVLKHELRARLRDGSPTA